MQLGNDLMMRALTVSWGVNLLVGDDQNIGAIERLSPCFLILARSPLHKKSEMNMLGPRAARCACFLIATEIPIIGEEGIA
jgi:hypothetical protein